MVQASLEDDFTDPPESASPWVFWYWLKGAVSEEGITADLEAMAENGIGGAYLMPLIEPDPEPFWEPPVRILSPEFWSMVKHSMAEADRLGLELGMHVGPGFSLAGGPWITPELSMQRVVWTETHATGGKPLELALEQPEAERDYYRDIAVFAYPAQVDPAEAERLASPKVSSSLEGDFSHLADPESSESLRTEETAWIEYAYEEPVTVRSVRVQPQGNNFQSLRLRVEASDDGEDFRLVEQLQPPRHGWQDPGESVTYALPETTATHFRFVYDPEGSEPGAEDLDWAKWQARLRVRSIELLATASIDQIEGKSAAIWRVGPWTTEEELPESAAVPREEIVDVTEHVDADGVLRWQAPEGEWTILRMGHTTTGATNYTGGAGEGLEADKLNPEAIRLQFDQWFGEVYRQVGEDLASRVLKVFHSDSWEAESQNWSPVLPQAFLERRGYDMREFLPIMAGVPIEDAETSERFLHDLRQTVSELVAESYFGTLRELAHERGTLFSSESVAPTMVSDNLRHHGEVDIPMGEFWLRSPTHDKPFDMRDAVSGAHIYGKPIVRAEAFTQVRLAWDEAPDNLKALGDLHFALGVNHFVFHVFMQTPWVDRVPGVSLNGVGLFFQRGQTWWEQGRAWIDYIARVQALLQQGIPQVDVAVFAGEELPSRSLTPDRLVTSLPGIFGDDVVAAEEARLANPGNPRSEEPKGVKSSARSTDLGDWNDPLNGYAYDSINRDALLRLATVRNGRLELPGGASYGVLVLPRDRRLNPEGGSRMSIEVAAKLREFAQAGLPILLTEVPTKGLDLEQEDVELQQAVFQLAAESTVQTGAYNRGSFEPLGVAPDLLATELDGSPTPGFAWTHRATETEDFYFVSNQEDAPRYVRLSLRQEGRIPEIWNPVTGERKSARSWRQAEGRTELPVHFAPHEALFIVFREKTEATARDEGPNTVPTVPAQRLDGPWTVQFPGRDEPVTYDRYLDSWTLHDDSFVRYFSGTATYERSFEWNPAVAEGRVWLDLGSVANIAEVFLNGESLGVVWTAPWRVEATDALRTGVNEVRIEVTNTWANRLIGDHELPEDERTTWTNAPYRLEGDPLEESGLLGPVLLTCEVEGRQPATPVIPFPEELMEEAKPVSPEDMQKVYEEVKTPHKYGIILKGEEGELFDCPNVFRHGDKWYMMYVAIKDGLGYQTFLAESDDLLHWTRLGKILGFPETGWDKWQGDGGVSLMDYEWGGSAELQSYEDKYWMSYIGGSQVGYETDPLSAGLAWTRDPSEAAEWTRFDGNPVLAPNQPYSRRFEEKTVYKSHIIRDPEERLGWPFIMYYNGKEERGGGHEAIYMAVSKDMKTWHRYGENAIIYNGADARWSISGDPQIVKMGDLWVMFYFGAFWKPDAFDTFAVSHDLVNWTKWNGPDLVSPSEPYDKQFAHKPWVIKHDGVVYHFYCAVGDEGRVIALATSEDLRD